MIEYWETVSSFEEQEKYQRRVPFVSVTNEMINQWEDWQPFEDPSGKYLPPVFSIEEAAEIEEFQKVWNEVASNTLDPLPALETLKRNPEWEKLLAAGKKALETFMKRGKLDEKNGNTEQEVGTDG